MKRLTKAQVQDFIEGAESLSPQDKKQVQAKVDEVMDWVAKNKKEWSFSSSVKPQKTSNQQKVNLGDIYDSIK